MFGGITLTGMVNILRMLWVILNCEIKLFKLLTIRRHHQLNFGEIGRGAESDLFYGVQQVCL